MHGVQPVLRLHCAREACAGGGCTTCLVDGATWRAMASTATMVPKDCSLWSPPRAAHLPAHQRGRWMDGAAQVRGTDPARARGRRARARLQWHAQARWPRHSSLRSGGRLSASSARRAPRSDIVCERVVAVSCGPLVEPPSTASWVAQTSELGPTAVLYGPTRYQDDVACALRSYLSFFGSGEAPDTSPTVRLVLLGR